MNFASFRDNYKNLKYLSKYIYDNINHLDFNKLQEEFIKRF